VVRLSALRTGCFYPQEYPGTYFVKAESTPGTWTCQMPRKKSPVIFGMHLIKYNKIHIINTIHDKYHHDTYHEVCFVICILLYLSAFVGQYLE
jgi:hypothetical protein